MPRQHKSSRPARRKALKPRSLRTRRMAPAPMSNDRFFELLHDKIVGVLTQHLRPKPVYLTDDHALQMEDIESIRWHRHFGQDTTIHIRMRSGITHEIKEQDLRFGMVSLLRNGGAG